MKLGVIGYGNMGSMIVNNILNLNLLLDDEEIIVSNRHLEKIEHLQEEYPNENIQITSNNKELAKQCDKIIITVKTPEFKGVIEEILDCINENTHIIYTCAGLNFKHIETFYDGKLTLIIPTIASTVTSNTTISSITRRKGVNLVKHNSKVNLEDKIFIEDIFNEFSFVKEIKENRNIENSSGDKELEISTILTSCGPAFVAIMIEKLAEVISENSNIKKKEADEMILKTVLGTTLLEYNQSLTNKDIINRVATKKGITQEGVDLLDKELDKIFNNIIKTLEKKYGEVNKDMDNMYLK